MNNTNTFQSFDNTKCYLSIAMLERKLIALGINDVFHIIVKVPFGENVDRYTAIFRSENGDNIHIAHLGFKVM